MVGGCTIENGTYLSFHDRLSLGPGAIVIPAVTFYLMSLSKEPRRRALVSDNARGLHDILS